MKLPNSIWGWPLTIILLLVLSLPLTIPAAPRVRASTDCVVSMTGDLEFEIESIVDHMPGPDSDGMVVPTGAQLVAWQTVIDATASGDLNAACGVIEANSFPYRIVRYRDTRNGGSIYWILKENLPTFVGWGTYVLSTSDSARDLVVEVPHPGCEWRTEEQGVEVFRQLNARALLVAGTHRCANTTYSPCDGVTTFCGIEEPHRTSDVAHATQTMFDATHRALVVPGSDVVAVQLHGCSEPTCPDLFISNATCVPGDIANRLYARTVALCSGFSVDIADCVAPECSFVGTSNVQGRFSNGVYWSPDFDACTQTAPGPSNPEQFLHLEQSPALRQDDACLIAALRVVFPYRLHLPMALAGHVSETVQESESEVDRQPAAGRSRDLSPCSSEPGVDWAAEGSPSIGSGDSLSDGLSGGFVLKPVPQ